MESILARALEYTLKYWLKSFSRDQFKLQGRTAQLSNLDINGDALHASMGLPPALNVATAKLGKLEIILPYVSNVQIEPIVVQIDRLDLVLEENQDVDAYRNASSNQPSSSSGKGSGYGFADKIADGMTVQVSTVNLLLETRGGSCREGGAAWASPLASITMRNLSLYTTDENWQVVNLKEARDFSTNTKFIYVFKKLEWESLSVDLLPHPDMFADANLARSQKGANQRDDDGAKRVFFGGERFLEGISGQAHITVQRTKLNSPIGLEVQLHITEAVCPALSEPGLRALLRFLTGLYVCLNRGDADLQAQQRSTEAAGRSLVSIVVDHVFLCIKDAEFQLELLLMQSLLFSRESLSDGENSKTLTKVMIGGLFLSDTFSRPPCILIQPSIEATTVQPLHIPRFANDFLPPIYPLGDQQWQLNDVTPLVCLHSLQVKPSPVPPFFASQTVITCQPLVINLQEESCLRISSFIADGIVVNPGTILPDFSVNSFMVTLKGLDVTVPLDTAKSDTPLSNENSTVYKSFGGARLRIKNLFFSESPSLKFGLLNLEKDPACFCFWEDQPIDASQKKWKAGATELSLSLELCASLSESQNSNVVASGLWTCVEIKDSSIEVAMASADGSPLIQIPPPGGVVRVGVACQQFLSNTSVEQLFFVLDFYVYFGRVSEKIALAGKSNRPRQDESASGRLLEKVPSDTAASLAVKDLQLRFLESSSVNLQAMPLAQFIGEDLFIKVTHRTLGGAIAVTSTLCWESVEMDCVDAEGNLVQGLTFLENPLVIANGHPQLRSVFWVDKRRKLPFLDISVVQVIPFDEQDRECHSLNVSACVSGVRLGGGMNYAEALLHRFGILGPDGGPGEGLSKGLKNLSAGPLSKLFKASPLMVDDLGKDGSSGNAKDDGFLHLGMPDDIEISVELKDWLFALEGAQEAAERWWVYNHEDVGREERCWQTTFESLLVKAKSSSKHLHNIIEKSQGRQKYPVELVTVGVEGLQTLKPQRKKGDLNAGMPSNGIKEIVDGSGGINLEVRIVISEESADDEMGIWMVENMKFSVNQPIEAVMTKDELQHLAFMCKSEVDSMGRIAAGVLRLLKLEKSVGKAAIDQLSNLGGGGFDKIFSPKLNGGSSSGSIGNPPSSRLITGSPHAALPSTVASLEEVIKDSQAKCDAIVTEMVTSGSFVQHLASIEELSQKLESMKSLLAKLHTQF